VDLPDKKDSGLVCMCPGTWTRSVSEMDGHQDQLSRV